ncbi:MAG: hypothetical protein KF778_13250 [Rhodocyclaceae bacterium]|nr:hypothetical protein [Rhodocyclaceae bacterium]MBX3669361.1 hypothetical protein [Rhodocyclaceae bacterium]
MSSTIRQSGQFLLEGRADCRSWMAALDQAETRLRKHHRLFTLYMWLAILSAVAGVVGFVVMQEFDSFPGIAASILIVIFAIWLAIRMYHRRACKFTAPARALVEQIARRLPKHHALFLRCDFSHPVTKSFVQSQKTIPFGRLDFKHYEDRWLSGEIAHGDELRLRFTQIDTLVSKEKVKKRIRRDKHKPAKYRLDSRYTCLLVLRGKGFVLRAGERGMQMRRGNRAARASSKRRSEWSASKPEQGGDTAPLLALLDQLSAALAPAPAAGR